MFYITDAPRETLIEAAQSEPEALARFKKGIENYETEEIRTILEAWIMEAPDA